MPGAPLLIIRPDLIINWWNLTMVEIDNNGTSTMYFTDTPDPEMAPKLTVEQTKAFLAFAKNIGDTLNVKSPQAPQAPQSDDGGDARSRFAGLTGDE